jgi:sensor histidine kinase regulating citrate/malate metabolism
MKNIKNKLSINIMMKLITLILIITFIMIYVAYNTAKQQIKKQTKQSIENTTIQTARLVDARLSEYISVLKHISNENSNENKLTKDIVSKINHENGTTFQIDKEKNKNDIGYIGKGFEGIPQASNPIKDVNGQIIF